MERSGRRKALCVLLFLVCVAVSFLLKTCHYNMEAARVAEVIGDAKALYFGDFRDALPLDCPSSLRRRACPIGVRPCPVQGRALLFSASRAT